MTTLAYSGKRKRKSSGKLSRKLFASFPPFTRSPFLGYPRLRGSSSSKDTVHRFLQTVDGAANVSLGTRFITQGAALTVLNLSFTLADCPQYASFVAIFDQYRIERVDVQIMPTANVATLTAAAGPGNYGIMGTIVDKDGAALTTLAQFEQYEDFTYQPIVRSTIHRRSFVPRASVTGLIPGPGTSSGVVAPPLQWLDAAVPTFTHYGMSIYLDPYAAAANYQIFQVMMTYHLAFRNVR